jgi:hypothetical protein
MNNEIAKQTDELLQSLIKGNSMNNRQIALFAAIRIKEADKNDPRDIMTIADAVYLWLLNS